MLFFGDNGVVFRFTRRCLGSASTQSHVTRGLLLLLVALSLVCLITGGFDNGPWGFSSCFSS